MRVHRSGVTLPELILSSWLFALVLLGLARFAASQGQLMAESHDRLRVADFTRTVDLILGRELHALGPDDLRIAADSVRLRAVRGSGVICASHGAEVTVRYAGVRQPDPNKDSALVITSAHTDGMAHRIVDARSHDACRHGIRLTLDPAPPASGLVLVFETGSYHLSDGALRYRRGRAGRQPVTDGILARGDFRIRPGGIEVRLQLDADSLRRLSARERTHILRIGTGDRRPASP